ncbi:hypothetical protein TNIN_131951 [Trichonephila inaurata madagascariensis]|uniref:Uncharacterized protein n=1 Tax=Trichonephila inaurata madagascariensis TaxID=2747483 RepID=A0A8X6YB16_9ARAC|nr:hypothetical protein TNIN_131951 [Trichonephila inaurata madagascariensis]
MILHLISCQIRTFEQETKREISLLKNPDLSQNEDSKLQRKTSKIVQTYHHIVKKILPADDFGENLNSGLQNSPPVSSLDKNMNFMREEEGSKISFRDLKSRNRFRRSAKKHSSPYFLFKYSNDQTPEGVLNFDHQGNPYVVYYDSQNTTGMTSNEIAPNEIAPNGIASNKIAPNGMASNKIAPNRIAPNRIAPNRIAPNGIENGVTTTITHASSTKNDYITQNILERQQKSITSEKPTKFKELDLERSLNRDSKNINTPPNPTFVPKLIHNQTTTRKSNGAASERNDTQISLSSLLNIQSLIGAMQREFRSAAPLEKRSGENEDRKNPFIIIKPNPGLKIVPEIEYSTEPVKSKSRLGRDLPPPISVVAIWVVSCISLSIIVVTSFTIYCVKSRRLSKKPSSCIFNGNEHEKERTYTFIKENDSLVDSLKVLNYTLEEVLHSLEVYDKDVLQEVYSSPRHLEMLKGLSRHKVQIHKFLD